MKTTMLLLSYKANQKVKKIDYYLQQSLELFSFRYSQNKSSFSSSFTTLQEKQQLLITTTRRQMKQLKSFFCRNTNYCLF